MAGLDAPGQLYRGLFVEGFDAKQRRSMPVRQQKVAEAGE